MNHDPLDGAIDQVAAQLTHVDDDPALASRIVSALPERSGWLPYGWVSRFAVGAVAALTIAGGAALVVQRSFNEGSTKVLRVENAGTAVVELAGPVTGKAPGTPIVEPSPNPRRTIVEPSAKSLDFDRSLLALAALETLGVGSLAPDNLPAEDALAIAPLAVADLPLTAEFSPTLIEEQ